MDNIYEDDTFFDQYSKMSRSQQGLAGAGEWHQFQKMFPDMTGMTVLDLGCGYGWHCKYAVDRGAAEVLGLDLSERMIGEARAKNADPRIVYAVRSLEEYDYPPARFDCVISNLALHYVEDLGPVFGGVFQTLKPGGVFLLNMEHPVFTAGVNESWVCGEDGKPKYWPIDDYFYPGERVTRFLGETVKKQHHTLTQILMGLINAGFGLERVEEATPDPAMLDQPGMADELRRPMMLLVRAAK